MFDLPKGEFWDFSLTVYKQPDVSTICLALQDDYGANINMLLFACWLGYTGRGIPTLNDWQDMLRRTRQWRVKVILPLRSARRHLRDESIAPHSLKDNILKCEFDAEHIEQLILEQEWGTRSDVQEKTEVQCIQDMAKNLHHYCQADDIDLDDELKDHAEKLLRLVTGLEEIKVMQQANRLRAG